MMTNETKIPEWSDEFISGHAIVDNQHKRLFYLVKSLHTALSLGQDKEALTPLLENLSKYVANHFDVEERLMEKTGYPELDAHRIKHQELLKQASKTIEGFQSGALVLTTELSRFLASWVKEHIGEVDLKMIRFVREKQGD